MAQIDSGAGGGARRRDTNRDLPLVPFIDFLLCLVSFLLITAVWSESARLDASANVPGKPCEGDKCHEERPKRLHVEVRDKKFALIWKQGDIVLTTVDVERKPIRASDGSVRYPELEARLAEEWKSQGAHRDASDQKRDEAVLHTDNRTEFGELVAVIDALHAQKRELSVAGATGRVSAFDVTFAAN